MNQHLSPQTNPALDSLSQLDPAELVRVLTIAHQVIAAASARTPEQSARAISAIYEGIQAARARGFTLGPGPDGAVAITVRIESSDGRQITCLLPDAAYGKGYHDLITYGTKNLKGAWLLQHDDFVAVVGRLCEAIRGMKVVNHVLDTDNPALRRAYRIATEGVRTSGGWYSWAEFKFDEANAVVGFDPKCNSLGREDDVYRNDCALFGLA